MTRKVVIDIFVEDRSHEAFLKPLIERIAQEEKIVVLTRVRSARGGHGKAMEEYSLYQDYLLKGFLIDAYPDLIVVAIDGNCLSFSKMRGEIQNKTKPDLKHLIVGACPDPHVERWYLADPNSFYDVVGHLPKVGRKKCKRDYYKNILTGTIRDAGHPIILGGMEFAQDLVTAMDLYQAGRNDHSLDAFVNELRGKFRQVRTT
jgi:hypothetical protein